MAPKSDRSPYQIVGERGRGDERIILGSHSVNFELQQKLMDNWMGEKKRFNSRNRRRKYLPFDILPIK